MLCKISQITWKCEKKLTKNQCKDYSMIIKHDRSNDTDETE